MLIVAIDTSGRTGSVALCRASTESFQVLQMRNLEGGTYSAQLVPYISEMLKAAALDKGSVDAFVVVLGPGSFTGLRVGLATAKGLCEALNKPLVTVSMLEAVALVHGHAGDVTVLLDGGRGEVYVGEYRISADGTMFLNEYIAKLDDLSTAPKPAGELLTPDARIADALRESGVTVRHVAAIHSEEIGRIGFRKLSIGETADPATADVNYIRRSDAEIFSAPKP